MPTADPARARWVPIVIAALAMVATLPGRTHGLGLITEPLLADLRLDRVAYANINLFATLFGAAFCLPCGWLIDRFGGRVVLLLTTLALAASVALVAQVDATWGAGLSAGLFSFLLLTRGFGQSALSVVSLAIMGKSVGRRGGFGVGIYSCLTALGFMAAFGIIKYLIEARNLDWRALWHGIGLCVAAFGCVAFVLLSRKLAPKQELAAETSESDIHERGLSLAESLHTPAFWIFAGATSLYGLIAAGLSLFNQSILGERGFDRSIFLTITVASPVVGLVANLGTGWLAQRVPHGRLLAGSMLLLTLSLVAFPYVRTLAQVYLYAVAMGIAGGMVTVLFFGVWGEAFGPRHLGKIQGAAQMLTVFASAVGPLLLAAGHKAHGSYIPTIRLLAILSALFAVAAWFAPLPRGANDR